MTTSTSVNSYVEEGYVEEGYFDDLGIAGGLIKFAAGDIYRRNPITPQAVPALQPMANSHAANPVEEELRALFIELWQTWIRPADARIFTTGTPHLGPFEQVEQAVKAEGLALVRKTDEAPMRYVYRSWRARNPKRGLHMLRVYLQMLWPNAWTMNQMWAPVAGSYPAGLVKADGGSHFLTSRVQVSINGDTSDGSDVAQVAGALRSVVPARILLNLQVTQKVDTGLAIASAYYAGAYVHTFTGTCQ
jgi:hypothetical protein